ncbi:MAG: DMT family transporter [Elusimicrobia bacterium]|nr:DMT family transporter [Elusimicrobiota bacterium]
MKSSPASPAWLPAVAAAALFGLSAVAEKILLAGVAPVLLAGLLYLGAGAGLALVLAARGRASAGRPLERADLPWLGGAILAGGVAAPVLLLLGLERTSASAASLLLNLEAPFTALLAWSVFRDRAEPRVAGGIALTFAGAVLLSRPAPGALAAAPWGGSLLLAGSCLAWGLDNNLSQRVSDKDPVQVAAIKGLAAGAANCALAFALGARLPSAPRLAGAALVGFLGYGVSLVLFLLSLRRIGTARTSLYFSTAPFFGAAGGLLVLREPLTPALAASAALMAAGALLGRDASTS